MATGGLEVFATEVSADSMPTAKASTAHLKFQMASGIAARQNVGGSGVVDASFQVTGRKGTADLLEYSSGVAQA